MSKPIVWQDANLFESFTLLVTQLGQVGTAINLKPERRQASLHKLFSTYVRSLPNPLPAGIGKHLFRLLYPHEGSRRRYGFKETILVRCLEGILGSRGLDEWDRVDRNGRGQGCLGLEVQTTELARMTRHRQSRLTISEVDTLLDKLARSSKWSQMSQEPLEETEMPAEPRKVLLNLYVNSRMSPASLAVLTQIILRDLRPLLMPLPKPFNINSFGDPKYAAVTLSLQTAMGIWDFQMPTIYFAQCGDLDYACDRIEILGGGAGQGSFVGDSVQPKIGRNIMIPKCAKGRSIKSALKMALGHAPPPRPVLWAETKYDGERHVACLCRYTSASTGLDRGSKSSASPPETALMIGRMHMLILSALGVIPPQDLPRHERLDARSTASLRSGPAFKRSIVIEAELVPYNESPWEGGRGPGIEEFWKLNYEGIKSGRNNDHGSRHLHVAFFDCLLVDGVSLLNSTYAQRRRILERVVNDIQGFSHVAIRQRVDVGGNLSKAEANLATIFEASAKAREGPFRYVQAGNMAPNVPEGLVLKAEHSIYNAGCPWVKLKRDYIPNLGDCVDLVCLGAGWDMDRARELRVDTSVYTTFYLGVCTNQSRICEARASKQKPHFEILFRVSWGLERQQMVDHSMRIHHRDPAWTCRPYDRNDPRKARLQGLSYSFHMPDGMIPPSIVFDMPRCIEVMGAGFQKLPKSPHYELRWPRVQKIFDLTERPWTDALDAAGYLQAARSALGYNRGSCPSPNSIDSIWDRSTSIMCLDVVSSPEKSTISPLRLSAGYVKPSPLSPAKTISLSHVGHYQQASLACTALQSMMALPCVDPFSLPPVHLTNTPKHQDNSPKQHGRKQITLKKHFCRAARCLHAKQVARRGGISTALSTGLRRKAPRALPKLPPLLEGLSGKLHQS